MPTRRTLYLLVACFLIGRCQCLNAQQSGPSLFDRDPRWELGVWAGQAVGGGANQAFGNALITMAGFHASRVVYESPLGSSHRHSLEYTIELQPLFLTTQPRVVYGGGFSPIGLKWNFAPRDKGRYRPYVEFNGGGMFTQKNVPPGRTNDFNFTAALGPGVMIALNHNRAVSFAVRWWHLSNANQGHINPAFNTVQLVVGYHWLIGVPGARHTAKGQAGASVGNEVSAGAR